MNDGNAFVLSLKIWESLWKNKNLVGIPTILVLNKIDLFLEDIHKNPLSICPSFKDNEAALPQRLEESKEQYQTRCQNLVVDVRPETLNPTPETRNPEP